MSQLTATGSTAAMSDEKVKACINFRFHPTLPDTPYRDRPVYKWTSRNKITNNEDQDNKT